MEAGIPSAVTFATKGQLARAMLARAFATDVPAAWVTGDTVYGDDGRLRGWLEEQRRPYVLAVSCRHTVRREGVGEGPAQRVEVLMAAVAEGSWQRLSAGDRSQGPRWYDWACLPLPYVSGAGMAQWVLARRSVSDAGEIAYFRAYGPAGTPLVELVRVVGTRWIIEESFARAKGTVGLDQYEVRRWVAWYRHITLALLAHAYLEVTRAHAAPPPAAAHDGGKKGGLVQVHSAI